MMLSKTIMTLLNRKCIGATSLGNKIHITPIRHHQSYKIANKNVKDSSLWYTTLPKQSLISMVKSGKPKKGKKPAFMPSGPLLISCKREEFNHYKGMYYKKMAPVPLASKGWHSKKANGDYFSILGKSENKIFAQCNNSSADEIMNDCEIDSQQFKALGLSKELVKGLKSAGFEHPTHIQQAAIPKLLAGKNLVITGETGCGKTLAYVAPILEHIMRWKSMIGNEYNSPLALIVVPSRELALQVENVASKIANGLNISTKVVLADYTKKFLLNFDDSNLENVDLVVSTPGVMCKFTYHKVYRLTRCLHVVIDEADTLLDDSFSIKLQKLLNRCKFRQHLIPGGEIPKGAQLTLVSATIPVEIEEKLCNILPNDSLERLTTKYLHKIPPHITQNFIRCKKSDKPQKLLELVKKELENQRVVLIFSNKTETCNWIAHFFRQNDIKCARLNKRMNLTERVTELNSFKEGRVNVLTCTDIASRGQDIPRVSHVVNYEFPNYMADYVHRSGRTGRIGNDDYCEVTSFISRIREIPLLNQIERSARTNKELPRVNNNIRRLLRRKHNKI